jgi:quinol monooxygenase YgiN
MAIRHVVIWTLHDPADAAAFKAELDSCAGLVAGMREFEVGIRDATLEANADVVLVSLFDDETALAAYQNHPHHQGVSARIGVLRSERRVVDYRCDSN